MAAGERDEEEPAVSSLWRRVLAWNYYDLWAKMEAGEGPCAALAAVPETFKDEQDYIDRFEPLMLEECAAVLLRGYEEAELVQPQRCVTGPAHTADGFLVVQVLVESGAGRGFATTDVILLTKEDPNKEGLNEQLSALGVLDEQRGDQSVSLRFFLDPAAQGSARERQRVQAVAAGLREPKRGFYITRLASLATLLREWAALHAIRRIAFRSILLTGARPPGARAPPRLQAPHAMREVLAREYNDSQMQALTGGLGGEEVVLIQGPPGTGKTRTLLGLLSILLHAAPEGSLGAAKPSPPQPALLAAADKQRLWRKAAPWVAGLPNPRDAVRPWEAGSIADVFGLLEVAAPVKVGRDAAPQARVLVCAPSNSALDEIVMRLLQAGVTDRRGQRYAPAIVRVGLQVHHSVAAVSLEALVERRLGQLASAKSKEGPSRLERERAKLAVLEGANIVLCTLSFSGSPLLRQLARPFDAVVIDEAAQAVEPSTLIPLQAGVRQVFLVGDPVQLPATVISKRAVAFAYDTSLFKRLQRAGRAVHVLDTQYRMHPAVSAFPAREFYGGRLRDGPGVEAANRRAWHAHKCFGPFAFYDVRGTETVPDGSSSLENRAEAELVLSLYTALVSGYPQLRASAAIGVISPYKAQVKLLRQKFREALGDELAKFVDINTIDGFQGREKEVAIFSAVRSRHKGNIGFVADERRINVGLTRARCSLLVIGNAESLQTNARWRNLTRHARLNRCFFAAFKPFTSFIKQVQAGELEAHGPTQEDLRDVAEEQGQLDDEGDGIYSDDETGPVINPALKGSMQPPAGKKRAEAPASTPRRGAKKPRA